MSLRRQAAFAAALLLVLFAGAAAHPAATTATQTIAVNTLADPAFSNTDHLCSLRAAITVSLANDNSADSDCTPGLGNTTDLIQINVTGTISLGSILPTINNTAIDDIEIKGPTTNAGDVVIDGGSAHQIFALGTGTGGQSHLQLTNLTVSHGVGGNGGAIVAQGTTTLTLDNAVLSFNSASQGGAIYSQGRLNLTNDGGSYVSNHANGNGGAIFGFEGPVTYNGYAMRMEGNSAGQFGGAIAYNSDATADFTHIERSLLKDNTASKGGVFYTEPNINTNPRTVFELTDSTLTGNGSVFFALDSNQGFRYLRDTFVDSGSLFDAGRGFMANSIVSGGTCHTNQTTDNYPGSQNLITPHSPIHDGCLLHNDPGFPNMGSLGLDPTGVSSTLAQNGGPDVQKTFRLAADSNAIDNGDPAYCGTIDARSVPRGINGTGDINAPQHGDCDIGAYEYADYVVNFAQGASSVNEGDVLQVQVNLAIPDPSNSPLTAPLTVPIVVANSSHASSALDYSLPAGSVTFPAGSVNGAHRNFQVNITQNKVVGRFVKDINLDIQPANGAAVAEPKEHTVTITDDDGPPGVVVNDGGGTSVSEATPNTPDTFSIALKSQPDCAETDPEDPYSCGAPADVTVHIEPDRDCTVSHVVDAITTDTASLGSPIDATILNADWQTGVSLSVKAVNDLYDEDLRDETATHFCRISFSFSSGDPIYAASHNTYDVTLHDNDVAGVTLVADPDNGNTAEGSSTTNSWTVKLDTPPDPGKPLPSTPRGDTTITATPNAACDLGNGGGVAKGYAFNDDTWNTPQTITATAVDNNTVELLHDCTISLSISSPDPVYQNLADNPSLLPSVSGYSIQDYSPPTITNDPPFVDISTSGGVGHSGVSVSEVTPNTADTVSLVLERRPLANVTYNITASTDPRIPTSQVKFQGPDDSSPAAATSVTFTPANWNQAQQVKVFAVDDHYDEIQNLHPVSIISTATPVTTTAVGFNNATLRRFVVDGGAPVSSLSIPVSITDNDVSGVTVTQSGDSTNVTEGGATDSFTVVLDTHPYSDVAVSITEKSAQCTATINGAGGDGHSGTIAADDWATGLTVTVTAVDDRVVESSPKNCAIGIAISSDDDLYDPLTVSDVTAHVTDNDMPTVLISTGGGIAVSEAHAVAGDSYTVVLGGKPDANVTVHVSADGQTQIAKNGGTLDDALDLLFTPAAWDTAQTVNVFAVDDAIDEADPHTGHIAHSVVSTAYGFSDSAILKVDGTTGSSVAVSIADDDTAGVSATADPDNGPLAEGGDGSDSWTLALTSQPIAGPPADDPTIVTVTPNAACDIGNGGGQAKNFSFALGTWSNGQTLTTTAVDNQTVELAHDCTLALSISSPDPVYSDVELPVIDPIAIQDYSPPDVTDDPPFIDVATSGGTGVHVSEGDAETPDTVSFVLERRPALDVTVHLTASDDPGIPKPQVRLQAPGDASPMTATDLTFTPDNWDSTQIVQVFAVDDHVDESANLHPVTISASVNTTAAGFDDSDLRRFVLDGAVPASDLSVPVAIADNDVTGLRVVESGGSTDVAEGGVTDQFRLVPGVQPNDDLTITIAPKNALCAATIDGAPGDGHSTVLAAADWATGVSVTVNAVEDNVVEQSPIDCRIHTTVSSADTDFDGIAVDDVVVHVTDDERPVVLINTRDGLAVSEDTPTIDDTYKVRLANQPDANVQVVASANDGETLVYTDGAPAPSVVLTFTPADFATPQIVHVVAVDDTAVEARPHSGTISHKTRGSATGYATDPIFRVDSSLGSDVNVSIADNDFPPPPTVHFSKTLGSQFAPLPVHFDASNTTSSVRLVKFKWDFGDGTTARGQQVDHTFATGSYRVQLVVTDSYHQTSEAMATIHAYPGFTWSDALNPRPTKNRVIAGSVVGVAFSLGGNFGQNILRNLGTSPFTERISCNTGAVLAGTQLKADGATKPALSFDGATGLYTWAWQSDLTWAGTCRTFQFMLDNGVTKRIDFAFAPPASTSGAAGATSGSHGKSVDRRRS